MYVPFISMYLVKTDISILQTDTRIVFMWCIDNQPTAASSTSRDLIKNHNFTEKYNKTA